MPDIADLIGNADAFPALLKRWTFLNHAGRLAARRRSSADAVRQVIADASENGAYLDGQLVRRRWSGSGRRRPAFVSADKARDRVRQEHQRGGSARSPWGSELRPGDRDGDGRRRVPRPTSTPGSRRWPPGRGRTGVSVAEETDANGRRSVPLARSCWKRSTSRRTRVLTLSHVEFASGQRHDLATIGAACRSRRRPVQRRRHPVARHHPGRRGGHEHRCAERLRSQVDARPARPPACHVPAQGRGTTACRPLLIGNGDRR